MDWVTVCSAAVGAAIPILVFAFWFGNLVSDLKHLSRVCQARARDHEHHYAKLNEHSVSIGKLDTRVQSLEEWRHETV